MNDREALTWLIDHLLSGEHGGTKRGAIATLRAALGERDRLRERVEVLEQALARLVRWRQAHPGDLRFSGAHPLAVAEALLRERKSREGGE